MKHYAVTEKNIKAWNKAYENSTERQIATMALAKSDLTQVDTVSQSAGKMRYKFSVDIKTLGVTNQKRSGRCWLFAATNVLREKIAKQLNLEEFELSQSYLAFWDKFERANYFLESMLDTADLEPNDRTVSFILQTGVHDGGQWDMFANVVEKYGVVPKDVFDETFQSSNTNGMNHVLNRNLKVCAIRLREMVKAGKSAKDIHEAKDEMLGKVYAFLCSCYGEPPRTFDFEYVD
ncbi:MAG: aminopeptidase, partial [Clostridia bacterium]|nr:aminopeptidase [Clostridia bacterium]